MQVIGTQVGRLLSRTCEQPRVVWAEGRQAWVEMALSNEVYKRRLAFAGWWADAAPAEQLMGQSNLVFALDEAGWQVSKSHDELSVRPGQVCLDGPTPAVTRRSLLTSLFGVCAGLSCSGPHHPCLLPACRPERMAKRGRRTSPPGNPPPFPASPSIYTAIHTAASWTARHSSVRTIKTTGTTPPALNTRSSLLSFKISQDLVNTATKVAHAAQPDSPHSSLLTPPNCPHR